MQYITRESGRLGAKQSPVALPTLSSAELSSYTSVEITVEDGPIRFTVESGVTPTANGYEGSSLKYKGAVFSIYGTAEMINFKFISALPGKQAIINYRFEGRGA